MTTTSYKYYCPKCKTYLNLDFPHITTHQVFYKNGSLWYELEHKIFRVIEQEMETKGKENV